LLLGLAFASPRSPLPDHIGNLPVPAALVPRAAVVATSGFGVALVVMAVFYWRRTLARNLTERVLGVVSKRIAARVAEIVSNMSNGFQFLTNFRYTLPYLAVTAVSIITHILAVQLLASAVGVSSLTFARSAVVVGVLALGFALPNAPGFFGAVQLAMYAGLVLYLDPAQVTTAGSAIVFLFYVSYLGIVLGLSLISLLAEYLVPAAEVGQAAPG
jgi:glycosyltransferase 2 family protein